MRSSGIENAYSENTNSEFDAILKNFENELPESLTQEAVDYFVKQVEALKEIEKLETSARAHAHSLLTEKNKETLEFKYTPEEVLNYISSEKD